MELSKSRHNTKQITKTTKNKTKISCFLVYIFLDRYHTCNGNYHSSRRYNRVLHRFSKSVIACDNRKVLVQFSKNVVIGKRLATNTLLTSDSPTHFSHPFSRKAKCFPGTSSTSSSGGSTSTRSCAASSASLSSAHVLANSHR